MAKELTKRAGIREIAESLGISIGTVDRALHGRSGISSATRKRVLETARTLEYTPNVAARNLKLSRNLRIAAFLPEQIASFFDQLRDGMRDAVSRASGAHVELLFHSFPHLGSGDIECMEAANWRQYDGVLVTPGDPERMASLLRRSGPGGPPLMYIASDAPRTPHLASVAVDATVSGSVAADLLSRVLPQPSSVVVITGDRRIQDHSAKLRGFAATLAIHAPHLALLPSIESHERSEDAYSAALDLFTRHTGLGGIYISTADSLPVLRAADEAGALGRVQIVTTDLFPELVPMIEGNHVLASLYQRPFTQGSMAVEFLCRYLASNVTPPPATRLAPHIILRSNLPLFLDRLEGDVLAAI